MTSASLSRSLRIGCCLILSAAAAGASDPRPVVAPHADHGGGEGDPGLATGAAQGAASCQDGFAGLYPCSGVDLESFVPLDLLSPVPDDRARGLWGWTDPKTRREYAIVPLAEGTSFVDVTVASQPRVVAYLPGATGRAPNREVNVHRDHALAVADGAGAHGIQVFDLTQLRRIRGERVEVAPTAVYQGVGRVHTITVNPQTGFVSANGSDQCGGGFHLLDFRQPRTPRFAGCYVHPDHPYVHDAQCVVYHGLDTRYTRREICFGSSAGALVIVDVTDKSAPRLLSATTYQGVGFSHQAWLTEDHLHLVMDDEADEFSRGHNTRTYIWDLADLEAPQQFATYEAPTAATDHNQYIHRGRLYQANYRAGLRILDTSEIAAGRLAEVGHFDIVPESDAQGFSGAWNVYPFFKSGAVIVSGIEQGLYVVRPTGSAASESIPTSCRPAPDRLCLLGRRYLVVADWADPDAGTSGRARSVAAGNAAGYFHFGEPGKLELMVKMAPFGGEVRFFYGQLTNLPFTIRVVDTRTGTVRRYRNGPNNCGGSDRFVAAAAAASAAAPVLLSPQVFDFMAPGRGISERTSLSAPAGTPWLDEAKPAAGCRPGRNHLCLARRRFRIELDWRNPFDGAAGRGVALPVSDVAGSFAYADPRSPELVVKALDLGDRVLVVWGTVSNLEHTLRVTDTRTGAVETFGNPPGTLCGGLEEAF